MPDDDSVQRAQQQAPGGDAEAEADDPSLTDAVAGDAAAAADEDAEGTIDTPAPEAEDLQFDTPAATQQDAQDRIREEIEELEEEFGDTPDILVDVHLDEETAEFFLEALPTIRQISREHGGKANFYIHREPNEEHYLMKGLSPNEFNTSWLQMQNPQVAVQAFDEYGDSLLEAVLVYPTFDEVDWDHTGNGKYTPKMMAKTRLIDTFFEHESVDPNRPNSVAFDSSDVSDAETVAKRPKPSF